ncbi:hypothetical protein LMG31884_40960 [Xanthomonas hydrangeae]|nr:hypothetical protein LMG31884_40960 [Xanthomonas hydrangeae]CAD7727479.1 hypothetical protein LMG31884_40960 [Xanthomonas hydrangeae]CAD7743365.1 hypothetical protein LMG31887_40880 [Xanthomonas hydrangeae]CAD7743368.1 hypothetical protein LMG31887_40880 [Xanthomonas hydrangeae]
MSVARRGIEQSVCPANPHSRDRSFLRVWQGSVARSR